MPPYAPPVPGPAELWYALGFLLVGLLAGLYFAREQEPAPRHNWPFLATLALAGLLCAFVPQGNANAHDAYGATLQRVLQVTELRAPAGGLTFCGEATPNSLTAASWTKYEKPHIGVLAGVLGADGKCTYRLAETS